MTNPDHPSGSGSGSDHQETPDCVIHTSDQVHLPYDEECEYCQAEAAGAQAELMGLIDKNNKTINDLAVRGYQDAMLPVSLRIDMLVNFLMSGNGRMRGVFEKLYHIQIAETLVQISKELDRAKLTQGLGIPNGNRPIPNIRDLKKNTSR